MRYSASDKIEIIRLVEQSHLPARRTLEKLGIPRSPFYRWYDQYQGGGPEGLADRPSRPDRVWNRIPEVIRSQIVDLALDQPELSPRELAVRFTDEAEYFVSEASVYRLLKAHDLITSPAYIVIKAAEEFRNKTTARNQLWQTDFTYLKITGWGWYYLSTVLDDFSRFIVAWKLCATMKVQDVTATLDLALAASGLDQMTVVHRPGCCRIMAHRTSRLISRSGWISRKWSTSGAPLITHKPRVKSSAGIRRSKTAACLSTTTCPAISNARSPPSWCTTTMPAITRASTILPRLTSTPGAPLRDSHK
jgi:transposase InsO family protein